jgi:hypothetical protein
MTIAAGEVVKGVGLMDSSYRSARKSMIRLVSTAGLVPRQSID